MCIYIEPKGRAELRQPDCKLKKTRQYTTRPGGERGNGAAHRKGAKACGNGAVHDQERRKRGKGAAGKGGSRKGGQQRRGVERWQPGCGLTGAKGGGLYGKQAVPDPAGGRKPGNGAAQRKGGEVAAIGPYTIRLGGTRQRGRRKEGQGYGSQTASSKKRGRTRPGRVRSAATGPCTKKRAGIRQRGRS